MVERVKRIVPHARLQQHGHKNKTKWKQQKTKQWNVINKKKKTWNQSCCALLVDGKRRNDGQRCVNEMQFSEFITNFFSWTVFQHESLACRNKPNEIHNAEFQFLRSVFFVLFFFCSLFWTVVLPCSIKLYYAYSIESKYDLWIHKPCTLRLVWLYQLNQLAIWMEPHTNFPFQFESSGLFTSFDCRQNDMRFYNKSTRGIFMRTL